MTTKKDNLRRESKISIERTKGIWTDFFQDGKVDLEPLINKEIESFDEIWIYVKARAIPDEWEIENEKICGLEVEIVWKSDSSVKWTTLLNYIEATDN